MDPVEPRGIKNESLLESAVYRQYTGSGEWYKYDNCYSNCATLIYGVIKNHSFHNGNKRTGLLCLIKHLYINGYVLIPGKKHKEIYDFIISIADNKLIDFSIKYKEYRKHFKAEKLTKVQELTTDQEINFISFWIKKNSISKKLCLKSKVKVAKLKTILKSKGIQLEKNGTKIKVFKEVDSKVIGIIKVGTKRVHEREYSLGNSLTEIEGATLKKLRRDFKLTLNDGVDNIHFYDDEFFLDEEIKAYKKIIYRLSKT
jgi:death-on-curing protein